MSNHSPITPPPDLTDKWNNLPLSTEEIFVIAAQWGANQELEACCAEAEWLESPSFAKKLRAARRPKPPSLKEQALEAQRRMWSGASNHDDWDLVRRALEQLPD